MTTTVINYAKILLKTIWPLFRYCVFRFIAIFLKTINFACLMYRDQNIPIKFFDKKVSMHNDANCDQL